MNNGLLTDDQLARRFSVIIKRTTWVDINELVDDLAPRFMEPLPATFGTV